MAAGIGKLRQAADELMDVREDVRRGLITLPVLHALSRDRWRSQLAALIEGMWEHRSKHDAAQEDRLAALVVDSGAPLDVLSRMRGLRDRCLRLAVAAFKDPEPVEMLVEHRWLQAIRAVNHGLCDPPPHITAHALAADLSYGALAGWRPGVS